MLGAARGRGQSVDHILFAGAPGLGKTTLSGIVAAELEVGLRITSGPALERAGDLAAILTNLDDGDVLFIDEIHRLPRPVEEVLYPAMEDFQLDIVIGKGPSARSIRLELPHFTLVGATTRTGLITGPLRDRFGFVARLDYYDTTDLVAIVERTARILGRAARAGGGRTRSPAGPAARPASPTACSSVSATTPRCASTAGHHRRRPGRARALRGRRARPRQGRPRHPHRALCHVLGPGGRPPHARGGGGRGARHHRGRLRAVPAHRRACSTARHGGGWPPPRPMRTFRSRRAPRRGQISSTRLAPTGHE